MKNRNALIRCILGVVVASAMLVVTWSTTSARFSYTPTTTTTTVGSSSKVAPPVLSNFTRIPFRSFLTPATITTDKSDYHPGERVTVTGSGFQAGETVTLTFTEDPNHDGPHILTTTADNAGGISDNNFIVDPEDVGTAFTLNAVGLSSGLTASTTFTDSPQDQGCPTGPGVVTVAGIGGSCVTYTPPQGNGPGNWEVVEGGSYTMTITGVTECGSGQDEASTITVFIQKSGLANFCFPANKTAPGTYTGTFTMPNPACATYPISYKCGAQECSNPGSAINARGPNDACTVHLRASTFDSTCARIDTDDICTPTCSFNGPLTPSCSLTDLTYTGPDGADSYLWEILNNTSSASITSGAGSKIVHVSRGTTAGSFTIQLTINGTMTCSKVVTVTACQQECSPIKPLIGCPGDKDVQCIGDVPPKANVTAETERGESVPVSFDEQTSGTDCDKTITRTWTATNDCSTQSCSQTIHVKDTTKPELTKGSIASCYPTQLAAEKAARQATGVSDNCGGEVNMSASTVGDCSAVITVRGTDACGNFAEVTYNTKIDNVAPILSHVPSGGDLGCNPTLPTCSNSVTADDNCDGSVPVNCIAGEVAVDGCYRSQTFTYSAEDSCGNRRKQNVNYTWKEDHTAPGFTFCPGNITANAAGACSKVVMFTPTASDNCDGPVTPVCVPPSGFAFPVGITPVTCTATDICGNAATPCRFNVTIKGQICVTKFYDGNGNGNQDSGEVLLAGWKITLSDGQVGYTGDGSNGTTLGVVCFNVLGAITVTEATPTQTNWVASKPTSVQVTVDATNCNPSVSFGNYCKATNGLTLGFWSNQNGQKKLTGSNTGNILFSNVNTLLRSLNLRNANGTYLYTSTNVAPVGTETISYSTFKTWILNATATNMAYMLSAQLAATALDNLLNGLSGSAQFILPGNMKTQANACILSVLSGQFGLPAGACPTPFPLATVGTVPTTCGSGCIAFDGTTATVTNLINAAVCSLATNNNTPSGNAARTFQECLKDVLDVINNNGNPSGGSAYPCGPTSLINIPGFCSVTYP